MPVTNRSLQSAVPRMALFLEAMATCSFPPTYLFQISATRTVRRAATAMKATLPEHSWQDRMDSIRMKQKRFTKQPLHHKVGSSIS